jgi:type IV pilus assembly protein PilY1
MKHRKILLIIAFILLLLPCANSSAHDTDLYTSSGEGVEPNVLVIFDNSGSMNEEVQAYFYDPTVTYDPAVVPVVNKDTVYYRSSYGQWVLFKSSIAQVACSRARTALTDYGHYEGPTSSSCSSTNRSLRTGNYRNYLASIGGNEYLPKLTIAKTVIKDFLSTVNGVRVGFMVFNRVVTINGVSETEGGRIQSTIKSLTDTTRTQLKTDVDNIVAETWTPLAETLYEAGLYFKGGPSYFNSGVNYTSPIQYHCQRNYVILITDGESTRDRNSILATIGDYDHDGKEPGYDSSYGTHYLDDVAMYLYDTDLSSSLENQQNILTYTIGFTISSELLERTAAHGHGKYFYSSDAQSLSNSFQNIIDDILAKTSSFVAPIVPISRMEKTSAGDKIYLALFKPVKDGMWSGNMKKFGVAQANNPGQGIAVGDLLDAAGLKALDSAGQILGTARSFWTASDTLDGPDVERGGLGEVLMNRSSTRKIYTYMGTNVELTHGSNEFSLSNTLVTPEELGLGVGDTAARDKLIKFVHGLDAYDDNGNGETGEKRDWILGAFLHSRPLILHYGTDQSVIFAGSNDGALHAFDDASGEELWAFVPRNLLSKLQALHQDVLEPFVDGSPKAYLSTDGNKKILIFGQRRGGDRYIALDVSDRLTPKFLWEINPSTDGFSELAQTWSSPQIGKVKLGSETKWVAFITGGFDDNQDNDPVTLPDSKGRAIYMIDVLTGARLWRYSYEENNAMTYSIPSDIARVDVDGDGWIDRLYVGDMGGRLWRFDIGDTALSNWTGKIVFKSNSASGDRRKIFYPPDVTLDYAIDGTPYETLFIGTGDREHPKELTTINRLYAVKDKNPSTPVTEADMVDVTLDLLQDPTTTQAAKNAILSELATRDGWFIKLDVNSGEKVLSPAVVFYKTVYFSTFTPTNGTDTDPCYVGEGKARLYILKYNNGNAAFNLDASNDIGGEVVKRSDRTGAIGTAIPSGVIITFIGGTTVGYAGVGGGVYAPRLPSQKSLVSVNWRLVF